jgi:hypothetical protein
MVGEGTGSGPIGDGLGTGIGDSVGDADGEGFGDTVIFGVGVGPAAALTVRLLLLPEKANVANANAASNVKDTTFISSLLVLLSCRSY